MSTIILIEMYQQCSLAWPHLEKYNRTPELSINQILTKYQGYEGELKDIYYVKNHDPDLSIIYELFLEKAKINDYKILYVSLASEDKSLELPFPAIKVGYDVGSCEEECIFSSIISEVLFGYFQELVRFKDLLNENFLFPDKETAEDYVKVHDEMSAQGKGVEDYMPMLVYEIWNLN